MRLRLVLAVCAIAPVLALVPAAHAARAAPCTRPVTPGYTSWVHRALSAKHDVWGSALIARQNGPTYEAVRRLLKPLLFARTKGGTLTTSGVYYLPFAQPLGVKGAQMVALHVADGSEILSQTAKGPSLKVFVGEDGRERYGSCLRRLRPAHLASGYLPILETQYRDAGGTWYQQESFAVRGLGTGDLVSFVRLTADARHGKGGTLRIVPEGSRRGARVAQGTMSRPGRTGRAHDAVRRLARAVRRRPGRDRAADVRRRPRPARRLLDRPPRRAPGLRGPREGRQRRPAEPARSRTSP